MGVHHRGRIEGLRGVSGPGPVLRVQLLADGPLSTAFAPVPPLPAPHGDRPGNTPGDIGTPSARRLGR